MAKIRVALIVESALGGVARYVSDLVRNLDRGKVEVDIYYSRLRSDRIFDEFVEWAQTEGVIVAEVPMTRRVMPLSDLRCGVSMAQALMRGGYQVIHCHSSKAGALGRVGAAVAARNAAVVYTPHGLSTNVSMIYWGPEWVLSGRTDVLVAVSKSEQRQIERARLVRRAQLICIPPGVARPTPISPAARAVLREELGCGTDQTLVVTVGRLCREKDPALFYSIARAALGTNERLRFAWVGDGDRAYSQAAIGVTNVGFRADVGAILQAADIFLLTSLYESFGYATAEAMAAGLPVVATDVMGTRDLVDNEVSGALFERHEVGVAVEALCALASNRERRVEMGRRATESVCRKYGVSTMVERHQTLYQELALRPVSIAS